jgi:hypothetical protein
MKPTSARSPFLPGTTTFGKWVFYVSLALGAVLAGYAGSAVGDALKAYPLIVRGLLCWLASIGIVLSFALVAGIGVAKWCRESSNA